MNSILRKLTVTFLLALLGACSSGPFTSVPPEPRVLLVRAAEPRLDPPRSEPALLLDYYGQDPIAAPTAGSQLSAAEMRAFLESEGFKVFVFSGNLGPTATGIVSQLDKGRPLLVLVVIDSKPIWLLVVGIDETSGLLVVQGADGGLAGLDLTIFEEAWGLEDRVTILAFPAAFMTP